jgi:hypothetical protein
VGRLLEDGAAPAVTWGMTREREPGLEAFFAIDHKAGTRISRRELERLRASS